MRGRRAPPRQGQSLVELALLLPMLTLLLVGSIDLARVFYAKTTIANASRVAAEFAINWREADKYRMATDAEWRAATGADGSVPDPCGGISDPDACGRARATALTRWMAVRAASDLEITADDVAITFDNTAWTPNTQFTVTVTYEFSAITPMANDLWGGGPLTLEQATRMRQNCAAPPSLCTYS